MCPGAHRQVPVTWSHVAPFWQMQERHPNPYVPGEQGSVQLSPFHPAVQVHDPLTGWQVARFWHVHVWLQSRPNVPAEHSTKMNTDSGMSQ